MTASPFTPPLFPSRPDPVRHWGRVAPDRVAVVDRARDGRLTYAELDALADRWRALLAGAGVSSGGRVAALAGTRAEMLALLYACGRVGAALVPLNWRLAPAELGPVLADAAPRLLVVEDRFRDLAERSLRAAGLEGLPAVDPDRDAPRERPGPAEDAPVAPEDPALVLYTSGSTGRPKGVVLPQRQLLWNAVATTTAWELGHTDVGPVCTPLFHTGGWNVFATPLLHRGGTVVLLDQFEPAAFLETLAEERCTVAFGVPTQLVMLRESARWGMELPALRFLISGGAPCPPALAAAVRASGLRFRQGYGLTECGPNCYTISDAEAERREGSVGWPVPFLEMRLAADETGREAEPGEAGELLLRGPQMFGGYLNDPGRTAEALAPGGWLRTGDLARRDADGAYTICGRRKEMYISGGENVFPGEVESVLADHPAIAEAVVVGVSDPLWGEVGRAFVVRRAGAEASAEEVVAFARERLARYKVPRSVVFCDALPRLGSGKPDRRRLAEQEG